MGAKATGVDHYVLVCADIEGTLAWYRDMLGLEPVRLEEWRRGDAPFPSLRVDGSTIVDLLAGVRTGENVNHVAFVVDADVDALAASGDFDVVGGPADLFGARGQGRGIYVRDPEGNLVELRSYA